jgi:hypothetical protein
MAHDYRTISYLDQEDIDSILKPIIKPQASENAFFEEVDQQMSAKEFYKFDNISELKDDELVGVTKPEDINVEDMELDDKIDLVKKLITNIFDSREDNNNLFLDSFVDFKKLSERYIYEIDPEWVDEEEEAQQEENQPPEFEEALQNSTEEQPAEETAPEEESVAPEDQPGADQEVETPNKSEEDLINNAFA